MNNKVVKMIMERLENCNECCEACQDCIIDMVEEFGLDIQDVENIILYGENYIDKMYVIDEYEGLHIEEVSKMGENKNVHE